MTPKGPAAMAAWSQLQRKLRRKVRRNNDGGRMSLIDYAYDRYSQNGEDGIVARIFALIGVNSRRCCEFGAWDGCRLSNTRALLLDGWSGVMIEADSVKYSALQRTYVDRPDVLCLHEMVDDGENNLRTLLDRNDWPLEVDFVSIDVDGLDYEIFGALGMRPRVICVEVNAGHDPVSSSIVPANVAKNNVGQPLRRFTLLGRELGFRLVAYTGNAFFVNANVGGEDVLPTLTPEIAYEQFLANLVPAGKRWLYRVNRALAPPFYKFRNPWLTAERLELNRSEVALLTVAGLFSRLRRR